MKRVRISDRVELNMGSKEGFVFVFVFKMRGSIFYVIYKNDPGEDRWM